MGLSNNYLCCLLELFFYPPSNRPPVLRYIMCNYSISTTSHFCTFLVLENLPNDFLCTVEVQESLWSNNYDIDCKTKEIKNDELKKKKKKKWVKKKKKKKKKK